MGETLYDDDILLWSEQQAALLQHAAMGERVNGLDWPNLIEEIDSAGRSELQSCASLLAEALRHLMKSAGWPDSPAARHWLVEAAAFLQQAQRRFAPSMRQRLDLTELYRESLSLALLDEIDGRPAGSLPAECPFSLDDLLAKPLDVRELARRLGAGEAQ